MLNEECLDEKSANYFNVIIVITSEIVEKEIRSVYSQNNITKSFGRPIGPSSLVWLRDARVNNNRGNEAIISIATHLIICQLRHTSCDAGSLDKSTCR